MATFMLDAPPLAPLAASLLGLAACDTQTAPSDPDVGVHEAVEAASAAWIDAFNRGDVEACADAYSEDAAMEARPLADLRGRDAVRSFWKEVLAGDPGTLRYLDPCIHVLDARIAVLSSRWSMSRLGSGIITLERWERQDDSVWRLVEDRFEIREQKTTDTP